MEKTAEMPKKVELTVKNINLAIMEILKERLKQQYAKIEPEVYICYSGQMVLQDNDKKEDD